MLSELRLGGNNLNFDPTIRNSKLLLNLVLVKFCLYIMIKGVGNNILKKLIPI